MDKELEVYGKINDQEKKLWQEFLEIRNLWLIQEEKYRKIDAELDCKKELFWATVQNRMKLYGKNLTMDEENWLVKEMPDEEVEEFEEDED
jgi:hypothetical protein